MSEHSKYRVEGFQNADSVERGYDGSKDAETLKEAKDAARWMLTDSYRQLCEASECLKYCRVMLVSGGHERDDEMVWDIEA